MQYLCDITERKKAEQELKLSEERFMSVLYSSPDAILLIDHESFIDCNEATARMLGNATRAEFLNTHPSKLSPPVQPDGRNSFEKANEMMRIAFTNGFHRFEWIHRKVNGEDFPVEVSLTRISMHNKNILHCLWRDITERKEIEEGLEKTRKELAVIKMAADEVSEYAENLINTVREPLIALDQDLRVVSVSRSFYEFFKVKPEETVGQLIYDLGNKQWDIPKLRELLETILPEKAAFDNYEVEHDFATIGKRIMLLNARQIQRVLGKERIILLAIEDITERKKIEAGLEKTRKELAVIKIAADEVSEYAESVINTVREPLIALDQDLRVVSVSRSFYEFFKVKPEETVGHLIYDLGNKQWDIPKLRELLETILPQKTTFDNYEVEHDFATIGKKVMLLNARQIKRVLGKERIILLAIDDITEKKHLEMSLIEAHNMALAASRAKSDFISNMSHEFRTPLNSILGFPQVLLDEEYGKLNEHQRDNVKDILASGEHLLSLVNNILDLSSIEAGKMELIISEVNIYILTDQIKSMFKEKAHVHSIKLEFKISPDLPEEFDGDGLKISQVVINLISNAFKFTRDGGHILFEAVSTPDNEMMISITDNGPGISEELQKKLFNPFERLQSQKAGTGLGLALSKRIVELWNGKIGIVSPPEGRETGCRFYFTIPFNLKQKLN